MKCSPSRIGATTGAPFCLTFGLMESPPAQIILPFEPSRDGYAFRNSFTWTEADLTFVSHRYRQLASGAHRSHDEVVFSLDEFRIAEPENHIRLLEDHL